MVKRCNQGGEKISIFYQKKDNQADCGIDRFFNLFSSEDNPDKSGDN